MKKRAAWPKAARSILHASTAQCILRPCTVSFSSLRRLTPRPPSGPDRTVWALRLSSWPGLSIPVLLRGSLIVLRSLPQLSRARSACQRGEKDCRRRLRVGGRGLRTRMLSPALPRTAVRGDVLIGCPVFRIDLYRRETQVFSTGSGRTVPGNNLSRIAANRLAMILAGRSCHVYLAERSKPVQKRARPSVEGLLVSTFAT